MVLEQWNLGTLLRQVREEFGLTDQEDTNRKITDKVNHAVAWLIQVRQNWPWMRTDFVLDTPAGTQAIISLTQGSRTATFISGSPISPRDVLVMSAIGGDGVNGYIVTEVVGPTITLQSQYRGSTDPVAIVQIQTGFMRLPDDFIRLVSNNSLDSISIGRIHYKRPTEFDNLKNRDTIVSLGSRAYTIKKDPLGIDSNFYMAVFPYIASLSTLQGEYFRVAPKLINQSDVPIVTLQDSLILLHVALWLFAISDGSDQVQTYSSQVATLIDSAGKEFDLSDDLNEDDFDNSFPWIQGPANFQAFTD